MNPACAEPLPGLPGGLPALERLFEQHSLPPRGRQLVLDALQGDPVRRVGGGRGNVVVRHSSRKMGCVVQAESRNVELAFVLRCESDPSVVFYLCQPATLSVYVVDTRGRRRRVHHVPDYLVLDEDGFAFVECKSADELARDADRPSPRFVREGDRWRWPAAEDAAAELGLTYRIFSSEDVNPLWVRNLRFLSDFADVPEPPAVEVQTLVDCLGRARSLRLAELLASSGVSTETLWWCVAHRRVWCDLERGRVFELDQAWGHDSESRMLAHRRLRAPDALPALAAAFAGGCAGTVRVEPGASLVWDGVPWTVLNRGPGTVTLRCEDGFGRVVPLSVDDVERLLQDGALRGADAVPDLVAARDAVFRRASARDLDQARGRWEAVVYFKAHGRPPSGVPARSVRRFLQWCNDGERRYGSAFAGLVRFRGRRTGTPGIPSAQAQALREVAEEFADDHRAGRVSAAFARLVDLCRERDVHPPPSERTLRRALAEASLPDRERARRGSRAAYQVEGPSTAGGALFPPHGDRVFEVGHVDHTPLDVRLVSSVNGTPLGSPWLTPLMDAYSRTVLAFSLSFDAPSRASVLSVLHDCVRRHGRVPDTLVVDQGPEFHSNDVENALACLRVHKVERPARKARFGAVMERMFGTTNTAFVHELLGNTTLLSLGRGLSSDRHPVRSAVWTLPMVEKACERWLFEVYPALRHGTLGDTPRDVFARGLARDGERVARHVTLDDTLRVLLAQTVRGDTRRVDPVRGLVVEYLRYWHDDFQYGDVAGASVPVKLDVADCSVVFASVRGRWVTCRIADGDADLHGRSWKQVRMVVEELRARRRQGRAGRTVNAELIGRFLRETDLEGDLARQIARDAESRPTRPSPVPSAPPPLRLVATDGAPAVSSAPASDPAGEERPPPPAVPAEDPAFDYETLEPFHVD